MPVASSAAAKIISSSQMGGKVIFRQKNGVTHSGRTSFGSVLAEHVPVRTLHGVPFMDGVGPGFS